MVPALTALLLGSWGIGRDGSLWRDEAVTAAVAQRTVPEVWGLVQNIDAVHGLYYLLMHYWLAVWDGGGTALRLPSVLATAVAAVGVAAIAQRLLSRRAGVLAGFAYAVTPMVQHYAQEGRSYAWVSACVVWATWFFVRAAEDNAPRRWAAYSGLIVVACWLNLFAGFVLLAHWLTLRIAGASRPVHRGFFFASAVVVVGTAPLALFSLGQFDDQLGWLSRPGAGDWAGFLAVVSAGVLLASVKWSDREPLGLRALALPLLSAPSGLLLLLSMFQPYYVDRYVLYCMAGLALLIGAAADRAAGPAGIRRLFPRPPHRRVVLLAVAVVLGAVLVPWHAGIRTPEARKDDALAVSTTVREVAEPGDAVLFAPARRRDWLLHDPAVYGTLDDIALQETPQNSGSLRGIEYSAAAIRHRIAAADRIVTLADPEGQPLDRTPREVAKREALDRYLTECRSVAVHGARISVWARFCGPEEG